MLFVFASTLNGQINVNSSYLPDLEALEKTYLEENEVSKGADLIRNCDNKYIALDKAYANSGLTLDFNNFNKFDLKTNPELKTFFRAYMKALKMKLKYFSKDESFKSTIKLTYPDWDY